MPTLNLQNCIRSASAAARQAGVLLLKHVGEPTTVETKRSAIDLVTEIDRGAELLIRRLLGRAYPDFGFLGEEHGVKDQGAEYRWIIDPIDGTMNFVHGIPLFGVSIGLQRRDEMVAGVIYDPSRNEFYTAIKGRGAFVNGKRLSVSRTRALERSVIATGFSSKFRKNPEPYLSWFTAFETRCHAVRRIGTTVLCLAWIAAGRMEGFYEQDLWPWDIAAGMLIVEEAGGKISNFENKRPRVDSGKLVASNGRIHDQILRVLRQSGSKRASRHAAVKAS